MKLEDCISFLLGKAAQQVTRRARDALAEHGVTPVQFAALSVLSEADGQSSVELGARLVLDSASVTGVVDRLEAGGLVRRRPDPGGDRRVQRLHLTEQGRALMPELNTAMERVNGQVAAELEPKAPVFWATLKKLGQVQQS